MHTRKKRWVCVLMLSVTLTALSGTAAYVAPKNTDMHAAAMWKTKAKTRKGWKKKKVTSVGFFGRKYRVCSRRAVIRSGPGKNYPVTGQVYKNDVIRVKSIQNGWAKFKVNSRWCYIAQKHLVKISRSSGWNWSVFMRDESGNV